MLDEEGTEAVSSADKIRPDDQRVGVTVKGVDFLRIGTLAWGSPPFGLDPTLWECDRCAAVTADAPRHAAWHRDHG